MIRRDLPAFNVAMRGIAYFHVTLRTGTRDLHSGMYGGAALNAAHALIKTLGATRPEGLPYLVLLAKCIRQVRYRYPRRPDVVRPHRRRGRTPP